MGGSACPSASSLLAFVLGALEGDLRDEIEEHLGACASCKRDLHNLKAASLEDVAVPSGTVPEFLCQLHSPAKTGGGKAADSVTVGDIWLVESPATAQQRLVLALDSPDESEVFTAALLSPELDMATERDAILNGEQSSLGYPVLVEAANCFPVTAAQCVRYLGSIQKSLVKDLRQLGGVGGLQPGSPLTVGQPLLIADDPRVEFQLQEAEVGNALSSVSFEGRIEPAATTVYPLDSAGTTDLVVAERAVPAEGEAEHRAPSGRIECATARLWDLVSGAAHDHRLPYYTTNVHTQIIIHTRDIGLNTVMKLLDDSLEVSRVNDTTLRIWLHGSATEPVLVTPKEGRNPIATVTAGAAAEVEFVGDTAFQIALPRGVYHCQGYSRAVSST